MLVRAKKRPPVRKMLNGQPTAKVPAQTYSFPAPIRGWVLNENLAQVSPGSAVILDNWFCTSTGVRARGGSAKYATLPSVPTSLFAYRSAGQDAFFGADASGIYDITTVADPDVAPTPIVGGQTSGDWSTVQFGTVANDYIVAVNGSDDMQQYDGTSWQAINGASTPAITGVATADLSHVWSFANRLFFVEKDTMTAWYLPVDSIGGAALDFSLSGVFKRGGSLLFGSTWSLDAGDGLDDKCVFFSSEGEVAVYEGSDPSDATAWRKVGVYYITKPLGPKAIMQAGGDLVVATQSGVVPISEAIRRDSAALEVNSFSRQIAPYWTQQVERLPGRNWEILKWPEKKIMIVSQPSNVDETCLVASLDTGAWSRVIGWDTETFGYYDGRGFYGAKNNSIYEMDITGSDDGDPYTVAYLGQHEGLGVGMVHKEVKQARAVFRKPEEADILPLVAAQTNYDAVLSPAPDAVTVSGIILWNDFQWNGANWPSQAVSYEFDWVPVGRSGFAVAPEVQLTFDGAVEPSVELISVDMTFDTGGFVT